MSDLYLEMMCGGHPVQEEWKRRLYDRTVLVNIPTLLDSGRILTDQRRIWFPRQEDWQKIYEKNNPDEPKRATLCRLDGIIDLYDDSPNVGMAIDCLDEEVLTMECVERHRDRRIKHAEWSKSKDWTVVWCLFVSREVYGLEWDWEGKRWKKV